MKVIYRSFALLLLTFLGFFINDATHKKESNEAFNNSLYSSTVNADTLSCASCTESCTSEGCIACFDGGGCAESCGCEGCSEGESCECGGA